jgi:3-isopropylmalate/(R)-2-methylmalate dehydratase large subunit
MAGFDAIWEAHLTGRANGAYHEIRPDLVYGHEGTLALIVEQLRRVRGPRLDSSRLFWVVDHFAPPSSGHFADILKEYVGFCREKSIPLCRMAGIGHLLMLESDRVRPGMLVVGADSHTTTIGGKGAVGIGLGSTDIMAALMTGTVWLRRPEVSRIRLTGRPAPYVEPKDVVLHLLGRFGQAGFLGRALEFLESADQPMSAERAAVLTNMTVEMGAVTGVFVRCDDRREWERPGDFTVDLSALVPLVARPGRPDDVVPAAEAGDVRIDQVHVGSCAAGGLADLKIAAHLLSGRNVAPGVTLLITPGTAAAFESAARQWFVAEFLRAGAVVLNPSCGACGGIDKGIPATRDVVVTTGPRNYGSRARIGSSVYLASTATAVASAIAGRIVPATEVVG